MSPQGNPFKIDTHYIYYTLKGFKLKVKWVKKGLSFYLSIISPEESVILGGRWN